MPLQKSSDIPVNLILANKERLIPVSDALKLFPVVGGKSKSLVSVYRYIAKGCCGIVPKLVPVVGSVVNRQLLKDIPTGYEGKID